MNVQKVRMFGSMALAFDDYGRVAKIEDDLFKSLIKTVARIGLKSRKRESTILRETVQNWADADWLEWVEAGEANK